MGDTGINHFTFNKTSKTKQPRQISELRRNGFGNPSNLLYLKKRRELAILYDDGGNYKAEMHQFQLCNNQWIVSKIDWNKLELSVDRYGFPEIVSSANEEYIFLFGGYIKFDSYPFMLYTDTILVYNTKAKTFLKSVMQCPIKSKFRAVLMRNEQRDELIVYAFVNRCFQSAEYENIKRLPKYLIQLICQRMNNEWIHLIDFIGSNHWKINIDEILKTV